VPDAAGPGPSLQLTAVPMHAPGERRPRCAQRQGIPQPAHAGSLDRCAGPMRSVIMLAKDAALWSGDDKTDGLTSTKVVKQKSGAIGLFRYRMNGDIIDSFINNNVADESIVRPDAYKGVKRMEIVTAVQDHNLAAKYGDTEALSSAQVVGGSRPVHFAHGDASHGIGRENKYTWHHKSSLGKMELIDMNVHGAMWHYGGISGWGASVHTVDSDDDPSG
jgi:hypothetical protein